MSSFNHTIKIQNAGPCGAQRHKTTTVRTSLYRSRKQISRKNQPTAPRRPSSLGKPCCHKTELAKQPTHNSTKQTWRVLGKAGADLVEAVSQGADHLGDPLVSSLEHPQVGDGSEAQGTALVLLEGLLGATPAQGVIAR